MLQFKGSSRTIPEIAHELRATALVEGSLVRIRDRIRVSAQLLEGLTDQHLWADTYEGEKAVTLSNLCGVAGRFAHAIDTVLTPRPAASPSTPPRVNAAAQVEYLKYRYYFAKWTREGLQKGIAHLQQALEIDPTHAPAYSGLAWSLAVLGYWGFMPIGEAYPKAKAAALQALSIDPSSDAHVALGLVKWLYDWDLAGTRDDIQRAMEMSPSNEHVHILRGLFLATMERDPCGAVEEAKATLDVDPLSPMSNFSAAYVLLFAGEYEQAAERARHTLVLYPDSPLAMTALAWAEVGLGHLPEATSMFEKAAELAPGAITSTYVAFGLGLTGRRQEALALLGRLTDGQGDRLPEFAEALIHIGLGDVDRAFECMEHCLTERDSRIFWFPVLPGLDSLRADPRFAGFMGRVAKACRS
jgi:tetratricopeptide (TPR) repeat protein